MWRHKGFRNPYGDEWFTSGCTHQYNLGEAYERGYNDCIRALFKLADESPTKTFVIDSKTINAFEGEVIKEDE